MDGVVKEKGAWTAKNEIDWLDGIGTHRKDRDLSPKACLEGYLQAAKKRTDWGGMDVGRCLDFAASKLAGLVGAEHEQA